MSEQTEELRAWDNAHVWHPFTPHAVYRDENPLLICAGEGNYLIDTDGRRYLDGVASLWCNTFGHRVAEIDDAIRQQLEKIAHATLLGNASEVTIRLAKKLTELTPAGLTKVFYSDNGSTAVEVALKMAYQYCQNTGDTKRTGFLALKNAYHGDTIGAVSVGGIDLFHERFRALLFDVVRAPSPDERGALETLERLLLAHHESLAAVIVEPGFLGAGGIITYPPGFLLRVDELAKELGVFLIFDEVAAGMGRSGAMFACQREGITPDFLCLAKGITGGYLPLAATVTTERVYNGFLAPPAEGKTFFHGHTYTGNALAAAAAIATLEIFEQRNIIASLAAKIEALAKALDRLRGLKGVIDIRQYGLAAGVELGLGAQRAYPAAERRGLKVCARAIERGVFLRPLGDVIVIMPPLSITREEIDTLVDAVANGIREEIAR